MAALNPRPNVRIVGLERIWRSESPIPVGADVFDWLQEGVPEGWDDKQCGAELKRIADEAMLVGDRPEEMRDPQDVLAEILCLADVEPKEVRFLWAGKIPLGTITTLAGDPGLGKSFMVSDLAARVSTARHTRGPERTADPVGLGCQCLVPKTT